MGPDRSLLEAGKGRANNFDALRVALALMVIFSHSYPLLLGSNDREPLSLATGGQRTAGEIAVDGFFLISGFLIALSWQRSRGLADYLRRRVLRIYPGFLVAVAFCSLVVGPLLAPDVGVYWKRFDVSRFLILAFKLEGALTPGLDTNGSLWSIRYEFFCYLAIAGMGLIGMLRRRPLVAMAALACSAIHARQLLFDYQMPGSRLSWLWCYPGFWPRLAACFLAGSSFYLYSDRVVLSTRWAIAAAARMAAAAALPSTRAFALLIPWLGGYLLFYLAFFPAGRLRDIARRGDLTYGLYLYAFPVQVLLVHWFKPHLNPIGLFFAATAVTAVLAALSWHLVERPCLRLKSPRPPAPHAVGASPALPAEGVPAS